MSPLVLIAGVVLAAPPEPAGQLPLRLAASQEFVYRGLYTETTERTGARYSRRFGVETYILVLGQTPAGFDVAYLTVQRPEQKPGEEPVAAARLEMGKIDSLGRLRFAAKRAGLPHVPLE